VGVLGAFAERPSFYRNRNSFLCRAWSEEKTQADGGGFHFEAKGVAIPQPVLLTMQERDLKGASSY